MKRKPHSREDKTLVLALLRSQQLFMRAMAPVFRAEKLTASQWDALETLSTKGALTINELMTFMLSTSGNLDVVIKNLIQAGFVEKTVDKADKRARVLRLTDAGAEKVAGFAPIHDRALDRIFAALTREEKRATLTTLNRFRKKLLQSEKD